MQEIINFQNYRFKSIHLHNMKLQLTCLFLLTATQLFGQMRNNRTEVGMGYGSYTTENVATNSAEYIHQIVSEPIDFGMYSNGKWYSNSRQIRNYDMQGLRRIKQSKNLRRELYLGAKVAGQFQHRTLFIGTKENLEEETVVNQKTGTVRRTYAFQADAYSELNDYLNVSPYAFYRIILNDHFSVNTSLSTGTLIPLRAGIQKSSYTGKLNRLVEGESVLSEVKQYDGELTFEWFRAEYTPRLRFESTVSAEIRPSVKKPYYISCGILIGQQINFNADDAFTYSGVHIGLQSQF
mgnify:FL=1|jgi:hypothetical protein